MVLFNKINYILHKFKNIKPVGQGHGPIFNVLIRWIDAVPQSISNLIIYGDNVFVQIKVLSLAVGFHTGTKIEIIFLLI